MGNMMQSEEKDSSLQQPSGRVLPTEQQEQQQPIPVGDETGQEKESTANRDSNFIVDDTNVKEDKEEKPLADGKDVKEDKEEKSHADRKPNADGDGVKDEDKIHEDGNTIKEEEKGNDGEEEEAECGFCLFMKGGGCKDNFVAWEKCVEEAEKNKEDVFEKCSELTGLLRKCMDAHSDYYEPILRAEKTMQEEAARELGQEAKSSDIAESSSKGSDQQAPSSESAPEKNE